MKNGKNVECPEGAGGDLKGGAGFPLGGRPGFPASLGHQPTYKQYISRDN